jgi:hypothetical protein
MADLKALLKTSVVETIESNNSRVISLPGIDFVIAVNDGDFTRFLIPTLTAVGKAYRVDGGIGIVCLEFEHLWSSRLRDFGQSDYFFPMYGTLLANLASVYKAAPIYNSSEIAVKVGEGINLARQLPNSPRDLLTKVRDSVDIIDRRASTFINYREKLFTFSRWIARLDDFGEMIDIDPPKEALSPTGRTIAFPV